MSEERRAAAKLRELIETAGGKRPADVLIRNARVVNVFTGETMKTNVAVSSGRVAGLGGYYQDGEETVDISGRYLLPGFIDSHIHVESTMLTPEGFAEAAVLHGTTTAVSDPHEITNVKGLDGYRYMVEASRGLPVDILYTVPSCVPASAMESSGAKLGAKETAEAFAINPDAPALSEMMDYPGVLGADDAVLAKIAAAARMGKLIDGHSPTLTGARLNAYLAAGISSDHECTTAAEALEKIAGGMQVLVREGTTEKNLEAILPAITALNSRWFCFATDDRHPLDLVEDGEIDAVLRKAVSLRLDAATAVQIATINAAVHYGLAGKGAVAPGYVADLVVVEDLESFRVTDVYKNGRRVVKDGRLAVKIKRHETRGMRESVILPAGLEDKIALPKPPPGARPRARVIQIVPDQVTSKKLSVKAPEIGVGNDILKAVVIERHRGTGNVGVGLVRGFGIKDGAIASTVAHDSHNLVAVGTNDGDIVLAARRLAKLGGGMVVVSGGKVMAEKSLPVAGLMTEKSPREAADEHSALIAAARETGCALESPFMTLSFIALPVIPELKLTDKGLVDVESFSIVGLWE